MRYTGPKCRLCRRAGEKLFLKGERCDGQKCAMIQRAYAPGVHKEGSRRKKISEYGKQLSEKQKVKRIYGMTEKPFFNYYVKASKKSGVTGDEMLKLLETRLDNTVFRAGFAPSLSGARQLVSHGLFALNGRRVNIPSINVKAEDKFEVREVRKDSVCFEKLKKGFNSAVRWIKVDPKKLSAEVISLPEKEDLQDNLNMSLIVEAYSR